MCICPQMISQLQRTPHSIHNNNPKYRFRLHNVLGDNRIQNQTWRLKRSSHEDKTNTHQFQSFKNGSSSAINKGTCSFLYMNTMIRDAMDDGELEEAACNTIQLIRYTNLQISILANHEKYLLLSLFGQSTPLQPHDAKLNEMTTKWNECVWSIWSMFQIIL